MLSDKDNKLKNLSHANRIEILTWNTQDPLVDDFVRLTASCATVRIVELIPLHGNIAAIESVLAVSNLDVSDIFIRVDADPYPYNIARCEFKSHTEERVDSTHPTYRVILAGNNLAIDKPSGIEYLGKIWDWAELFFNFTRAFHIPLQRTYDDPLLPKEFLVENMRENMGISDGMDAQIILDEMLRVGIIQEIEFELYRFTFNDPRMIKCMNWSGRTITDFPNDTNQLIQYLVALTNRTPHMHSREYLELLNFLQYLRGIPWESLSHGQNRKSLMDLYYVLMKQVDWATDTYERAKKEKFYFELKGGKKVFPKILRAAILETSDTVSARVSLEIMCELKWTLTGTDDVDNKIIHYACEWFCKQSVYADDCGTLHVPVMLKGVMLMTPFKELLEEQVASTKRISFYDLVLSLF